VKDKFTSIPNIWTFGKNDKSQYKDFHQDGMESFRDYQQTKDTYQPPGLTVDINSLPQPNSTYKPNPDWNPTPKKIVTEKQIKGQTQWETEKRR